MWSVLEKELNCNFPLTNVAWKSPLSSTQISIEKLPLRCMPAGASLFKDTDHPFRWFLAPYVNLLIVVHETMDSYKSGKAKLKLWVESHYGPQKRSFWLLLYMPMGSQTMESYQKIYSKLSSDFYQDRSGDRSCMVLLSGFQTRGGGISASSSQSSFPELMSKIRDGVISSFQQRCANYDVEIRRLDALRNSAQLDFRQLFLVKESLALMYQMMQLPGEALVQYEELEALLAFAPANALPESDWPFIPVENASSAKAKQGMKLEDDNKDDRQSLVAPLPEPTDQWACVMQQAEHVMWYSINYSRMRVLKNKVGILELYQYVFARECFFLFQLNRLAACAGKGLQFLTGMRSMLQHKLDLKERSNQLVELKINVLSRTSAVPGGKATEDSKEELKVFAQMADLWMVASCVQVTRGCWEHLLAPAMAHVPEPPSPIGASQQQLQRTITIDLGKSLSNSPMGLAAPRDDSASSLLSAARGRSEDDSSATRIKETAVTLCDLLHVAKKTLMGCMPCDALDTAFVAHRNIALSIADAFGGWNSFRDVAGKFPHVLIPLHSLDPELAARGAEDAAPSGQAAADYSDSTSDGIVVEDRVRQERVDEAAVSFHKILLSFVREALKVGPRVAAAAAGQGGVLRPDGPWRGDSALSKLQTHLMITLNRIIAEQEEITGRWRFAMRSKIECADALLCVSRFADAITFFRSALDPNATIAPAKYFAGGVSMDDVSSSWGQLRVLTLRKQMFCARALREKRTYVLTALSLLDPVLSTFVSDTFKSNLLTDVAALVSDGANVFRQMADDQSTTEIPSPKPHASGRLDKELFLPMQGKFKCTIQLDSESLASSPDSTSKIQIQHISKIIHDETFQIRSARCEAGSKHSLVLLVRSQFVDCVEFDSVTLVYCPFVPSSKVSSTSAVSVAESFSPLSISSMPPSSFECHPAPSAFNERGKIVIRPGVQQIALEFTPPLVGEYVPLRLTFCLGLLSFLDIYDSDLNNLLPFFASHTLINVAVPTDLLAVQARAPPFTPFEQPDSLQLRLKVHESDSISDLMLRVSSALVVLGSDSVAPASKPKSPGTEMDLYGPSAWSLASARDTTPNPPRTLVKQDCLFMPNIPGSSDFNVMVPFKILAPMLSGHNNFISDVSRAADSQVKYLVTFHLEGVLYRSGCVIDFECSTSCEVFAGVAISVDQSAHTLFGKEYFCQCVLTNISPLPWRILGYYVSGKPSAEEDAYVLQANKQSSGQTEQADASSTQLEAEDIVLHPGEVYHTGLSLAYRKRSKSQSFLSNGGLLRYQSAPSAKTVEKVPPSTLPVPLQLAFKLRRASSEMTSALYSMSLRSCCDFGQRHMLDRGNDTSDAHGVDVETYFDRSLFEFVCAVALPRVSPAVHSHNFVVEAVVQNGPRDGLVCGEPISCHYKLRVVFPPEVVVDGSPRSPSALRVVAMIAFDGNWVTCGTVSRRLSLSFSNDTVEFDVLLIPLSYGAIFLPPLEISIAADDFGIDLDGPPSPCVLVPPSPVSAEVFVLTDCRHTAVASSSSSGRTVNIPIPLFSQ